MNVVEALLAVSADVGAVPKGHKMQEGPAKYAYRSIEQITPLVHAAFIAHGIIHAPYVTKAKYREGLGRNGNQLRAKLTVRYTFTAADGSQLVAKVQGEALDTSDKATNKAMTAAWKAVLVQVLCIPLEDAGDPDHESPQVEPVRTVPVPDGWMLRVEAQSLLAELVGKDRARTVWNMTDGLDEREFNGRPYVWAETVDHMLGAVEHDKENSDE